MSRKVYEGYVVVVGFAGDREVLVTEKPPKRPEEWKPGELLDYVSEKEKEGKVIPIDFIIGDFEGKKVRITVEVVEDES